MFGLWEVLLILGVLFAVTFGGGIAILGLRALTGRRGDDEPPG